MSFYYIHIFWRQMYAVIEIRTIHNTHTHNVCLLNEVRKPIKLLMIILITVLITFTPFHRTFGSRSFLNHDATHYVIAGDAQCWKESKNIASNAKHNKKPVFCLKLCNFIFLLLLWLGLSQFFIRCISDCFSATFASCASFTNFLNRMHLPFL